MIYLRPVLFQSTSTWFTIPGEIHDVVIGPLKPDTVYYYRWGLTQIEFSFKNSTVSISDQIRGDLGQTGWTNSTFNSYGGTDYDVMLLPGDLSYADFFPTILGYVWTTRRTISSSRPWMPYEESASSSNLHYSFEISVHVIMLGSYADFESDSTNKWLQADLAKIDRSRTPWVFVLIHAPWYSTNEAHKRASCDVVFAGHVHAYERFVRFLSMIFILLVCLSEYAPDKADNCGQLHITIGDGGNREGLAVIYQFLERQKFWTWEIEIGETELYASWSWHRNQDDQPVSADTVWLKSLSSDPACTKQ
ncbi:hypothetical protein MKX03_010388 [Papaver bracteatum]|nr:hypothetical protein MKX03_010388 [Papaver bracteatum]